MTMPKSGEFSGNIGEKPPRTHRWQPGDIPERYKNPERPEPTELERLWTDSEDPPKTKTNGSKGE